MTTKPFMSREERRVSRAACGFDLALPEGRPSILSVDVSGSALRLSLFEEGLRPPWVRDWGGIWRVENR